MLNFHFMGRKYSGNTALDVVRALELDADDYPHRGRSVREFLSWSLDRLGDRLPPRDLDLSDRLEDEALSLSYLYLRDEYGAGKLTVVPGNGNSNSARNLIKRSSRHGGQ